MKKFMSVHPDFDISWERVSYEINNLRIRTRESNRLKSNDSHTVIIINCTIRVCYNMVLKSFRGKDDIPLKMDDLGRGFYAKT